MKTDYDSVTEAHIRDLILKAQKTGFPVYSDFLSDRNMHIAETIANRHSCLYKFFGGYSDSENVMMCIYSSYEPAPEEFPIKCLRISVTNKNASLTHRDYMGAVMSLGVERHVFGDIISSPTEAFVYVEESLSDYFISSLDSVGHEKCKVSEMPSGYAAENNNRFTVLNIIISSDRLDCFVSAVKSVSRNKSSDTIKNGLVTVNGITVNDPSKNICEGDKIVIRGSGKFLIGPNNGKTHKDRLKMTVHKYN